MANGGLNCVQVYLIDDNVDFIKFIKLVQKYDMYLIIRPGPFICAEWDFGGFPYWLNQEKGIEYRSSNPIYFNYVKKYFTVLLPKLRPYLYVNGGPIIMVQVENEYGFYPTCDHN